MKRLTNRTNLPLSVAVWLAADNYDFKPNAKALSATDLGKSTRALILRERLRQSGGTVVIEEDITRRFAARLGHAVHDAIETVWQNEKQRSTALQQLGIPKHIQDRIVLNPSEEYLETHANAIPVYMEQRTAKQILGYTISGQFDFLAEGQLEDFKSTGTWKVEKAIKELEAARRILGIK